MLEFIQELTTFKTKIPIYHPDGTILAVAKASQLYPTEEGKKAGVTMRHLPNGTVCEMNGKTLFEILRQGAAALKMTAELYTHDGFFLKWSEQLMGGFIKIHGKELILGSCHMIGCSINAHVGIQIGNTTKPMGTGIFIASPSEKSSQ